MFKRKKQEEPEPQMTPAQYAEALRANAIEYIVSLKKGDKERFLEAVGLIWEGYNKLDNVKTENERIIANERKKANMTEDDDELVGAIFEEELQPKPELPKGEA